MSEDRVYAGILMNDGTELTHYGVKGMKWGKRKVPRLLSSVSTAKDELLGKLKSELNKRRNPIRSQMRSALSPQPQTEVQPSKKRTGKRTNTVRSSKTGVDMIARSNSITKTAGKSVSQTKKIADEKLKKQREKEAKYWSVGRHN